MSLFNFKRQLLTIGFLFIGQEALAADNVKLTIDQVACPSAGVYVEYLTAVQKDQFRKAMSIAGNPKNDCIQLAKGAEAIEILKIDGIAKISRDGKTFWLLEAGLSHF